MKIASVIHSKNYICSTPFNPSESFDSSEINEIYVSEMRCKILHKSPYFRKEKLSKSLLLPIVDSFLVNKKRKILQVQADEEQNADCCKQLRTTTMFHIYWVPTCIDTRWVGTVQSNRRVHLTHPCSPPARRRIGAGGYTDCCGK